MSNKLKRGKKRKKKNKGHNSWLAVIWFTLFESLTSYSTDSCDYGGNSESLIESDYFLDELGKRRRDKLFKGLYVLGGLFIIALGVFIHETTSEGAIVAVIIGIVMIVVGLFVFKE